MPTVTLDPGPALVTTRNEYKPSSVTGSGTQFRDGSDATFATVWESHRTPVRVNDWAYAEMETVPVGATLAALTVHARVQGYDENGATGGVVGFNFLDPDNLAVVVLEFDTVALAADGSIHDVVIDLNEDNLAAAGWTWAHASSFLAAPRYLSAGRGTASGTASTARDWGVDVYELWLEATYTLAVTTFTPAPPARLSGRMDGLGPMGGPRRLGTTGPSRQSGFHPGGYY